MANANEAFYETFNPQRIIVVDEIMKDMAFKNYDKVTYNNFIGRATFEVKRNHNFDFDENEENLVIVKMWINGEFKEVKRYKEDEVKQIRYHSDGLELVLNGNIRLFNKQCVVEFKRCNLVGKKIINWTEDDDNMIKEIIHFIKEYQQSNRCVDENGMQNSVTCEEWLDNLKNRI